MENSQVYKGIREEANRAITNLIPEKSRQFYNKEFRELEVWMKNKGIQLVNEEVLLAYFLYLSEKLAPSSLWTKYSMVKTTLKIYKNIDISRYGKIVAFLKSKSRNYTSTKAKVLGRAEIEQFLQEASNEDYLLAKVGILFSIIVAFLRFNLFMVLEHFHIFLRFW
jgi:hypothetical protein